MTNSSHISLRRICESDIALLMDYWFRSPPGFIESLGVDWKKMPQEDEMRKNLLEKINEDINRKDSKSTVLVITYDDKAVGFHSINPLVENEYGIFHAHIFNPELRRKGICPITYPKACKIFIERFNLQRILFKTPVQNIGAIRVKEKLGIRRIGEEVIGFGIIKDGTLAKVFETTLLEIDQIILT